jgi:LuxR family maltose regulon positive regulatory protein
LVPRPQLIQQLDEGLHLGHRLTLVSAPAGFGKTTLLSAWLRQVDRPAAWLSLDDADNDLARFVAYLVAALQGIDPALGQTAEAILQTSQPLPTEPLLTSLVNDIAATPEPFIFVLDDYHVIESRSIHQAVAFLLDHLPPPPPGTGPTGGMHLVIATRADPPLPIARLRARGQLTELHVADLRFSPDEAVAFLNEVMGLSLTRGQIAALERRTEGWVTGLQLAALSLKGSDDVPAFIDAFTGSHRYVLDYLTEEVLNRQSEEVRAFLLETAILDRLTGPLCEAVRFGGAKSPSSSEGTAVRFGVAETPNRSEGEPSSGGTAVTERTDSRSLLETLEAANLFTVPLDDGRRWYRYHRLFADLLRQRLRREKPQLVPKLHRRASEWYEQNGLIPEAVSHALASGNLERAADLIEWTAWTVLIRGEVITLLGWLDAMPDDLLRSRPQLGVLRAWALAFTGQLGDIESQLHEVDVRQVHGDVAAVRAHVAALGGDVPFTIELAHQALEQLPKQKWFSRGLVALSLGIAYWRCGDLTAAARALTEAITLGQEAGQRYLTLRASATLGHVRKVQGLLRQSVAQYRQALELADEPGSRPVPFAGIACVGMAESQYEWNDLDAAMRHALEGIKLQELGGFAAYPLLGYAVLAKVHQARGDMGSAVEAMQEAERFAQGHDDARLRAVVADLQAWLWVAQGNTTAALRWARDHRWSPIDELDSAREVEQIAVARVLVASASSRGSTRGSEIEEALELLAQLLEAAEVAERPGSMIKILPLQALAFQAQGDLDQAFCTLERALSLAEPEGYVRTFVDEGKPMARLLRRALAEGIAPSYVSKLLPAFGESAQPVPPATQALVEPLTERELEVLRLIAAGLSNREIAQELVVALSTVKTHINHIYGKLDAKSRTQAVAQARALDLL